MIGHVRTPSSIAARVVDGQALDREYGDPRRAGGGDASGSRNLRVPFGRRQEVSSSLGANLHRFAAMKLGVHIAYWGLGLTAEEQLRSCTRPSGWATTRSGPPRPTAPMPPPCSPGWPRQTEKIKLGVGDLPDPGALPGHDGDDRGDARPALGRALPARARDVGAAGGRGLARPALRAASCSARASTWRSCARRWRASGSSSHGETLELPLPDGPGQGAEADDRAGAGADPDLPRRDRAEEHGAGGRDRRRLAAVPVLARARGRRAAAARGGRRALGPLARRLPHRADREPDDLRRHRAPPAT